MIHIHEVQTPGQIILVLTGLCMQLKMKWQLLVYQVVLVKIPDGVGMMMTDGGVAAVAVAVADLYCWCSYLVAVMGIRVSSVYDCCCA